MWIGHRKAEIRKLTFRALALRLSFRRRANARNVSFRISLRWPIHIINLVDKSTFKKPPQVNSQNYQSITTMFILIFQTYPNFSNIFDH